MRNYKKRSKYGVDQTTKGKQNRTVIDRKTEKEVCFDSLLEKRFYEDIVCAGLDSGEIVDYELQKKYKLQPSFRHNGKTIRAIDYVADFWVKYSDGSERVYDTKGGMVDPSAKIKRKLMYYIYPDLDYVWITHTKSTGWIDTIFRSFFIVPHVITPKYDFDILCNTDNFLSYQTPLQSHQDYNKHLKALAHALNKVSFAVGL